MSKDKMLILFVFVAIFIMFFAIPGFSTEEVSTVTTKAKEIANVVATDTPLGIMEWVFKGIESLLVAVLALGYTLIKKYIKDQEVAGKVNEALEASVLQTYRSYVKELKAGKDPNSPGGVKLTAEERDKAYEMALSNAKEILKEEGIELFSVVNEKYMPNRIKKIIAMFKYMGTGMSEEIKKNS